MPTASNYIAKHLNKVFWGGGGFPKAQYFSAFILSLPLFIAVMIITLFSIKAPLKTLRKD